MPRRLPFLFPAILFLAFVCTRMVLADQMIGVAIASSSQSLSVTGKNIKLFTLGDKAVASEDRFVIALKSGQLQISGKLYDPPVRFMSSDIIVVGGKRFRGELDVVVDGSVMTFVHPLPLETYVAGIVASEIPASWPMEALKAQAIASRTYAIWQKYRRIDKSYHLDASVLDQVYGGLDKEHARAEQAAKETSGLVLTYDAKPTQAYFYSSCGGQTASAEEVWGFSLPYLPGTKCKWCDGKHRHWDFKVSKAVFERAIADYKLHGVTGAKIGGRTPSGRVKKIEFDFGKKKRDLNIAELRQRLGFNNLRSAVVEGVEVRSKDIVFHGRGHGHGVGMCQWGANGMAKEGYSVNQILETYYPGTELRRLY